MAPSTHPLLRSIVAWAEGRPDVLAVVLTGTRSADEGTGDSVADFDVELAVADPRALADGAWLERIAPVLVAADDDEDGDPTWLVFFAAQQKVEFRLRRAGDAAGAAVAEVPGREVLFVRTTTGPTATGRSDADGASTVAGGEAPLAVDASPAAVGGSADAAGEPAVTGPVDDAPGSVVLRSLSPVFSTADIPAWLVHYRALGFSVSSEDADTGVATRDDL